MGSRSRWLQLITFLTALCLARGSEGDNSPFFQNCVNQCYSSNCTVEGEFKLASNPERSAFNEFMGWSCGDECQYSCMWSTVSAFQGRGWRVPQFYGKWPFIRILGLQEASSVVFSVLNFATQFIVLKNFLQDCGPDYPYFWVWSMYSLVCLNSWIWSMIFHARDTTFTEMMDYLAAFSVVTYFLFCFGARVWCNSVKGGAFVHAFFCLFVYLHHITYLLFVKFDYGYNMLVNLSVGVLTSCAWLIWCWMNRYRLSYVRFMVQFLLSAGATMLLEIMDFPPLLWMFDAHSLWHMSTIPLPFLLYRFVKEDCKYLKSKQDKQQ